MAQGNILPTPASFAVEKPTPIQVQAPLAAQVAAAGARPSQQVYSQASNNFRESEAILAGVNQDNLRAMSAFSAGMQEKFQKLQEDKFAEGFLRHMQGESVAKIADDNPFWGIFGDGGAVRGARAAQQQNASSAILSWVQDNQGDLAKMSADAQRKALADFSSTLKTGDPESDMLIAQGAMKLFPAVMDNLTRVSEVEQQRQAAISQADVLTQYANGLTYAADQVAKGQLAPEHFDYMKAQALQAAAPMPGQSPESYRAAMQGNVLTLTRTGQFEMANQIKDSILKPMLTPGEAAILDEQMKQSQATWLTDNPVSQDFTTFQATLPMQVQAGRYATQEQMEADIDRMNADYKAQTRSVSPLINNEDRARMQGMYQSWQLQQQEAAAKQNSKLMDEQAKRTIYLQGFAAGSPSTMSASGLDARQKAAYEQSEAAKFLTEPGLQSASNLGKLAVNGYTLAPLKEKLGGTLGLLKGGGIPKTEDVMAVQGALMKFKNTPYGMGAAEAYFGEDLPLVMDMQNLDMTKRENVQYIRERAAASRKAGSPPQATVQSASKLVDDEFKPGWWARTFGDARAVGLGMESQLKDDMKRHVADVMTQYPNLGEDDVLKMAAQRARKGTAVVGNRLITGQGAGDLFQNINRGLNIPMQSPDDPRLNTAIDDVVRTKVDSRYDFTVGGVNAFPNGSMYVTVTRDDGQQQNMVMSAQQVADLMNQKKAENTKFDKTIRQGNTYDAYGTNPGGHTAAYDK